MIGLCWTPDPNLVFSLGIEMCYTKQFSAALPETLGLFRSWHTTPHKLKFRLNSNSICRYFEEVSRGFKGVQHAGLYGSSLKETEANCHRCYPVLTFGVLPLDSHRKPHPTYSACNGVQPLTTNALWLGYGSLHTIWNSWFLSNLLRTIGYVSCHSYNCFIVTLDCVGFVHFWDNNKWLEKIFSISQDQSQYLVFLKIL